MQKKKDEKSKKVISQYKKVFNSHDGKAVLYDLMRGNFFLNTTTFVPGDPYTSARNEGQRDVVLRILFILKMKPEQFFQLAEAQESDHV